MNFVPSPLSSSFRDAWHSVEVFVSAVIFVLVSASLTGCAIGLEERPEDHTGPTPRDAASSAEGNTDVDQEQTADLALVRGDDERVADPNARRTLPPDMSDMDSSVAVPDCSFVTFSYDAPGAAEVLLTGDFAGWASLEKHGALQLDEMTPGEFELTVELSAGRHEYKFIVDGAWRTDPENPNQVNDGFGGVNAVRYVCAPLE